MRDASPGQAARRGTLTRRTLLGAAVATGFGALVPATGTGAAPRGWAQEVRVATPCRSAQADDPLPSWNDGPRKQAILDFVVAATDQSSDLFVPVAERIATFDQDGTLWVEHPNYVEGFFSLDRIKTLAVQKPAWASEEPFSSIIAGDESAIATFSEQDWSKIIGVSHAGMSVEEFIGIAAAWLTTAKHPRFDRLYTELIYQPMLEVMDLLREHECRTYIVSGGGQEFVRSYAEEIYGIPPEQVIGTTLETKYEMGDDGIPALIKEPTPQLDDNYGGKAEDINLIIGRRPAAAFGNSTGDQQMLEWTGAGERARLMMLVYHDDAEREYAYGPAGGLPNTHIGTFTEALMTEANDRGWPVISMKDDWNQIFP